MEKILFLAQFAPTNGKFIIPQTSEEEFYANTYHLKIYEVLKNGGYDFYSTNDVSYLLENHHKFDLVWSVYNRINFRNSEIFVQSLCEYFGVQYIGAAPNIRALVEDKSMSKQLAEHLGITTAPWVVASKDYPPCQRSPFQGPYFVKPRFGSASIGINESCICENWGDAIVKTNEYFSNNTEVIIEKYIDGVYYGVPIINTKEKMALIGTPHSQTSNKKGNVITYAQKRFAESGMNRVIGCDDSLQKILMHLSELYFTEMQPCDYARIDYIVEKRTGILYFLEVNVLMNLGIKGGFISSFLSSGFHSYDDIIKHIIELGLSRVRQ